MQGVVGKVALEEEPESSVQTPRRPRYRGVFSSPPAPFLEDHELYLMLLTWFFARGNLLVLSV